MKHRKLNIVLDPNPFHHAAALIEKMDRHDLEALSKLIAERSEELRKANCDLRWVSQDGRNAIANGKRGVYRILAFIDGNGEYHYCLTIAHRDARGSTSHLASDAEKWVVQDHAAQYDGRHFA